MKPVAKIRTFRSLAFAYAAVIASSAGCYTVEPPHRWDPNSDVEYFDLDLKGGREAFEREAMDKTSNDDSTRPHE